KRRCRRYSTCASIGSFSRQSSPKTLDRYLLSMPREHQSLQRQNECLQPQDQGMHQRDRVDHMQEQPSPGTDVRMGKKIMVVGIGIGDAQAAWWDVREPALEKRLEEDSQRARLGRLLRIDQNVRRLDLASRDIVLNLGDYHWNDGDRLGDAGRLG